MIGRCVFQFELFTQSEVFAQMFQSELIGLPAS